jgi:hypothetical protein
MGDTSLRGRIWHLPFDNRQSTQVIGLAPLLRLCRFDYTLSKFLSKQV